MAVLALVLVRVLPRRFGTNTIKIAELAARSPCWLSGEPKKKKKNPFVFAPKIITLFVVLHLDVVSPHLELFACRRRLSDLDLWCYVASARGHLLRWESIQLGHHLWHLD